MIGGPNLGDVDGLGRPIAGTFTVSVAGGVSDPMPYNADGARVWRGSQQAIARAEWKDLPRWKRVLKLILWGESARP